MPISTHDAGPVKWPPTSTQSSMVWYARRAEDEIDLLGIYPRSVLGACLGRWELGHEKGPERETKDKNERRFVSRTAD